MLYNDRKNWIKVISMIKKTQIFHSHVTDPYYNLATEKHLLETVEEGCCILYLWQNRNTVVIGRNQNAWAECRTSLLESEGGSLARRLSGGGAVYHDLGNLNFTFLLRDEDYDVDRQLSVIQAACARLGLQAEKSGRNDLLVEGMKFSGNAFYHSHGHAYHHGTLLVDVDKEKLSRYLTPSKAKLESKGIASVRSRVANLSQFAPGLTCDAMGVHMAQAFTQVYRFEPEQLVLSGDARESIQKEAEALRSWDWLYGVRLPFSFSCEARFPWGGVELQLQVESGHIRTAQLYSDAMDWTLGEQVSQALTGCRFAQADICRSLEAQVADAEICRDLQEMIKQQSI